MNDSLQGEFVAGFSLKSLVRENQRLEAINSSNNVSIMTVKKG
jgi:hypothetical protein